MDAHPHAPAIAVESEPGVATTEKGVVMLDGPNGVAISMTPDCAMRTGLSLIAAAEEASQVAQDI